MKKVVVIGAGVGGLAIANILAKTGYDVHVYDKLAQAGGRMGELRAKGFIFDTGPSWYLMPEVFEHYFKLLGEDIRSHLDLIKLSPAYKVFYDYHKPVTVTGSLQKDARTFAAIEPGAGEKLRTYVRTAERNYHAAMEHFLYNPFTRVGSLVNGRVVWQLPSLATQLTKPLHNHVARYVRAQPLQQILEYPMVFLGASPWNAPALYHLMSFLDFKQGVYYPRGGMYRVAEALQNVGNKLGVTYHFNESATKIEVANGRATAVQFGKKRVAADLVVSGADLHFTETKLLPESAQTYPQKYWQKSMAGPSALLMYLGVKGELPQLNHHNLFFVKDWKQNFADIFEHKTWPKDASIYVCKPSATDDSVAPKGHENVFVLVPLPAKIDHQEQIEAAADRYLQQLEKMAGIPDLRERIVYKKMQGPADFAAMYNSWNGTALGMAHLLTQSAFWRPSARSKKVKNLMYVGGGVQPGIGVPMCLISAEVAYKQLIGDHSAGPLAALATEEIHV
jgi:1-hydroxy-2-isopentenylcarotenoid 3,4-desaturase